jgi:hypothetical protein
MSSYGLGRCGCFEYCVCWKQVVNEVIEVEWAYVCVWIELGLTWDGKCGDVFVLCVKPDQFPFPRATLLPLIQTPLPEDKIASLT